MELAGKVVEEAVSMSIMVIISGKGGGRAAGAGIDQRVVLGCTLVILTSSVASADEACLETDLCGLCYMCKLLSHVYY